MPHFATPINPEAPRGVHGFTPDKVAKIANELNNIEARALRCRGDVGVTVDRVAIRAIQSNWRRGRPSNLPLIVTQTELTIRKLCQKIRHF